MIKRIITRNRILIVCLMISVFISGCGITETANDITEKIVNSEVGNFLSWLIDGEIWEESKSVYQEEKKPDRNVEVDWVSELPIPKEDTASDSAPISSNEAGEEDAWDNLVSDEKAMYATSGMIRYSFSKLDKEGRVLYRDIYAILINHAEDVIINSKDVDKVDKVFQLVMNDHPEIFYVTGYSMEEYTLNGVVTKIKFSGTYDRTRDDVEAKKPIIDAYVERCIAAAPVDGSDYDKAKYIYEYIINNTEYDINSSDNQNILSVFGNGKSVCQGYAKANQYLLNKLNIPCLLISGTVQKGDAHSWNMAYVDGQWTNIDVTWGDASYMNIDTKETWNKISYDYLCKSDSEFSGTHYPDNLIEVPKASTIVEKNGGLW